ncbi:MAG: DUF4349 domain-containing protein [Oscillospiraceae bacterium]|nr:DUF4349 domain-containing protein [Oscillospiraceae bacterium]
MKRRSLAGLAALLLALALAACGGGAADSAVSTDASVAMDDVQMEAPMETAYGGESYETASAMAAEDGAVRAVKMIRTATLSMETTAFDDAVAGLSGLTERLGGYYENSSIWSGGSGYRWADYTVRVPAERYRAFLEQAGGLCHLISSDESQKDVSEVYYDTQGRLKTQQIKLERLQALLAKAERMEDIITIESAISETEQQIDDLSGTLQHYDALVDYATVYISIQEVYKLSNVEEVPDSFASRIGSAFTSGWAAFTDGVEDVAVALAYGWMWVVLLAVIAAAAVRVLRKRRGGAAPRPKKQDDKTDET